MDWKFSFLILMISYAYGGKLDFDRFKDAEEYVSLAAGRTKAVSKQANNGPFTFDDIFSGQFSPKSFSSQWFEDHTLVYRDNYGNLVAHNAESGDITNLVSNNTFIKYNTGTYVVSSDLSSVLLASNITQVWRHSYTATYVIITAESEEETGFPNGEEGTVLQYAGWVPGGNALTYVVGNNLYYQSNPTTLPEAITDSGVDSVVFNGIPDWLYEEDVLSSRVANYWASDGAHVCYATFDDTDTSSIQYPFYGDKSQVYPQTVDIKYPKAGDPTAKNTVVTLNVVAVNALNTKIAIQPPLEIRNQDHYYTRVAWVSNTDLMVTWTNREQTTAWVAQYDLSATLPNNPPINHELQVTDGWIESPWPNPTVASDESYYLSVQPQDISGNGSWAHVARIETGENGQVVFLTSGLHEVQSIVSLDEVNNLVYFISTGGDPKNRHLFRKDLGNISVPEQCLTCDFDEEVCAYVSASMSSDHLYYMLTCSGPDIPTYTLYHINGTVANIFEDNEELRTRLATKAMPNRQFIQLDLGEGFTGEAEVFLPPNHEAGQQHPFLVYAYAGPGSQRVARTFPLGSYINNWLTYLKSSHGVVVASVDNRGSAARGQDFRYLMYKKLGTIEVWDQIMAGQQLFDMEYTDPNKNPAIFGWSYGGQTSALALANDTSPYQCGISVAPVTSKRYYDTAYTERYLGLESANQEAYDNTDVMNKAAYFANKTFMLAHGTDDDNVHFQHYAQLVKALVEHEIQFRQMVYVDENHSIRSLHASRHLFRGLTNFLLQDCGWSNTAGGDDDTGDDPTGGAVIKSTSTLVLTSGLILTVFLNRFI